MHNIILARRENYREVEEELKYKFVIHVLEFVGLPKDLLKECFPIEGIKNYSTDNKIKLREVLNKWGLSIVDNKNGELKIYVGNELIAHWKKSQIVFRRNSSRSKIKNQLYIEIQTDYWLVSEKE